MTSHPGDRFLPIALACALAFASAASPRAETIDRVLAVAAGQIITLSDVTAARDFGIVVPAAGADPIRATLTALVDRELILAEVDRYAPPEPAADEVNAGLAALRARFPAPDAFAAALARSGIDEANLRDAVRDTLRIRAYENQRFSPADTRRQALIDEWLAGLRRRGDVTYIYAAER